MEGEQAQNTRNEDAGPHLVLYDGACGLCHGLVQFLLPRDRSGRFHFAPLQSTLASEQLDRLGEVTSRMTTVHVITNYRGGAPRRLVKARATLFVATSVGWPWKVCGLLGFLPNAWLDSAYDVIARHRYRFFGRRDVCLVPRPEYRARVYASGGPATKEQAVQL